MWGICLTRSSLLEVLGPQHQALDVLEVALDQLFVVGEAVRTKNFNPATHTRLPRDARARTGVVEAVQGSFVFPDDNAHGKGENPQWLYTGVVDGAEIWGEDADPTLTVSIDAWEGYLEPA